MMFLMSSKKIPKIFLKPLRRFLIKMPDGPPKDMLRKSAIRIRHEMKLTSFTSFGMILSHVSFLTNIWKNGKNIK